MKATELIDHVAEAAGIEKSQAKNAVEAVFTGITSAVKGGSEVSWPGFGKFKAKDSPARQGRNPGTGETIEIAASRKLTFAQAKQVRDSLAS